MQYAHNMVALSACTIDEMNKKLQRAYESRDVYLQRYNDLIKEVAQADKEAAVGSSGELS